MSDKIQQFIQESKHLLGPTEEDLETVKNALDTLRRVSPELVDEKLFERFQKLVDTKALVESLQVRIDSSNTAIDALTQQTNVLQAQIRALTDQMKKTKESYETVMVRLNVDAESWRQLRKSVGETLEMLNQYLRVHT